MRLFVRTFLPPTGAARRCVVLLHGITGSHRTWWHIAPAVAAAGWRVLAMDLRCHGASGCDEAIGRWDAADDVVETVTAELGAPHLDAIWGHSLGARTALQALVRHPGLADRAVLEDPPGVITSRPDDIANWRREAHLARTDAAAFAAEVRDANPTWDERHIAAVVADVAACRIEPIVTAIERGLAMQDPADELVAQLRVPMLLLVPPAERSVLGATREQTIAALPAGSSVVELDGGHNLHRDLPAAYLEAALRWLG